MEHAHEEDEAEQPNDDRRHRADGLFGEANGVGYEVVAGIFRHVDAAENADRNRDEHRQGQDVDRVPEDRQNAAQNGVAGVVQDEARRHDADRCNGEVDDDRAQKEQDEDPGAPERHGGCSIGKDAASRRLAVETLVRSVRASLRGRSTHGHEPILRLLISRTSTTEVTEMISRTRLIVQSASCQGSPKTVLPMSRVICEVRVVTG